MRVFFFLLVTSLIVLPIDAESVQVHAVVKLVSLERVHDACGSAREFDACTRFVAYRLDVTCASRKMEAVVTFRPIIFLYNIQQLSHEQCHIEDIRKFAAAYVTDIEQETFETDSQCRAEAQREMDSFPARMLGFATRSNHERHPQLR
jgi:hypothetical protein